MAPNPRRVDARLQELYDQVPEVECDGSCHGACCFIQASNRERQRMERATGKKLETVDAAAPGGAGTKVGRDGRLLARYRCSMLTDDGDCSVYDQRPMVCRLFGAAEGLECHRGCKPKRMLTVDEAMTLLNEAMRTGGRPAGHPDVSSDVLRRALEDPAAAEDMREKLRLLRELGNARLEES